MGRTGRTELEDRLGVRRISRSRRSMVYHILLRLFRRLDRKTRVWRKMNAKSPVLIENLDPATPYTLFITVVDGQTEPFRLTEQFQTDEGGMLMLRSARCFTSTAEFRARPACA